MLLIEKLKLDPLAAVAFIEFVNRICWPKVWQERVVARKLFVERLVHP